MQAGSLQMHLKEKKMKMAPLRGNHFKKETVIPTLMNAMAEKV